MDLKAISAPPTSMTSLTHWFTGHFPMLRSFRLFFQARGSRPAILLVCLVIAGFAEAFSFGALVPAIALIDSSSQNSSSPIINLTRDGFDHLGIQMTLGVLAVFIAAGITLKALLSFVAMSVAALSRVRLMTNLRQELIEALLSARWSYFDDQRIGAIANTISTDIISAGNAYVFSARYTASLFQTLALVIVAFLVSWKVMAIGVAIAFLLMLILRVFLGSSYQSGLKHLRRTADLVALLVDTLSNLKALKTMNRKEPVVALMVKHSDGAQRARLRQELLKSGLQNSQDALTAIIFGTSLYFAATVLHMPFAELVGVGVLVFRIVSTFSKGQMILQAATESEGGYWRSLEFIANTKAAVEEDLGRIKPTLDRGCVFDNVSFSHGTNRILEAIDLVVEKGSITVLQGASGVGKTTIIDLMTGLYRPSSGRIMIDGINLEDVSLSEWRSMIGYVPQELSLLHTNVAENITLGDSQISETQIWQALRCAGAEDFVRALPLGLSTDVGEMGRRLSGGQRQRIALARAIVGRPKLLLLDEVTSALDPATERDICLRVGSLAGEFTIVAITHRPAWNGIATKLYNVSDGKVLEVPLHGSSGEMLAPSQGLPSANIAFFQRIPSK
jgi:ATP-binding cassette, subfamily C, bacterial